MNRPTLLATAAFLFVLAPTLAGASPAHRACVKSCKHSANQCKKTCTPPSPKKEIKECKANCVQFQHTCAANCPQ